MPLYRGKHVPLLTKDSMYKKVNSVPSGRLGMSVVVALGKSEVACSSPASGEHRPVYLVTERGHVCCIRVTLALG